jgi:hypothetical protein
MIHQTPLDGRGNVMKTYKVRSLDVWGHAASECEHDECDCEVTAEGERVHDDDCNRHEHCEGWNINNMFTAGTIEVDDNADDASVIQTMIEHGYLKECAKTECTIDDCNGMGEFLTVVETSNDSMPVYVLESESDD